eukprot:CAMPEP_0171186250 /NCGR_PEP_ID=MMETSP0790-20130122/16715_1 /TAXON_ID=2925 /ORGANISM="Alexandrium catenella, Strain OF101" /LENGTH=123 /DNA_ID=CAMNT_0011651287 /DNA_START=42 /DNA_END=411 /DNA_ORIENTATION=+
MTKPFAGGASYNSLLRRGAVGKWRPPVRRPVPRNGVALSALDDAKERRKLSRWKRALMCCTASEERMSQQDPETGGALMSRLQYDTYVGKGACLMPPAHPNMSIPWLPGYSAAWVRAGRLPPQ